MAVRLIKFYGDSILREKSRDLSIKELKDHTSLYRDLLDTMIAVQGIGLAAIQIGVPLKVYAIDPRSQEEYRSKNPFIAINLKIINKSDLIKTEKPEGCLSLPGTSCSVERYNVVEFEYLTPEGEIKTETAKGLFANIIQHEVDHGEGKLYIDNLNYQTKELVVNKFKKLKRQTLKEHKGEKMNGNRRFLSQVGKANQEALKPFIRETVKETMTELKQEILQEIVKYTDRLTQATGIRMRTLERALVEGLDVSSEEKLATVTMNTEDELLGLVPKKINSETVEEGDYVRIKVQDPSGKMEDKNWSFTRVATTPYETGNEELEKSVLGLKVGESKQVKLNYNNTMIPMNVTVINIRSYKEENLEDKDVQQG